MFEVNVGLCGEQLSHGTARYTMYLRGAVRMSLVSNPRM
jgi:hypothetical protein